MRTAYINSASTNAKDLNAATSHRRSLTPDFIPNRRLPFPEARTGATSKNITKGHDFKHIGGVEVSVRDDDDDDFDDDEFSQI